MSPCPPASTDAISAANPRVIDDSRARKLSTDLKRCTYYETCATYGLNVERVFQDGNSGAGRALWPAGLCALGGGSKLGFPLLPRGVIDSAVPCSGPEGGSLAEEAAAGHRALQVTAQLPQPLCRGRRRHPVRAHQPGAASPSVLPPSRVRPCLTMLSVCLPVPFSSGLLPFGGLESPGPSSMRPHLHPCGDRLPASAHPPLATLWPCSPFSSGQRP